MKNILGTILLTTLLFGGFLSVTYKIADTHLQQQENSITDAKEDWLFSMVKIECHISRYYIDRGDLYGYVFHYQKAYEYFGLALEMVQEHIDRLK